MTGVQTCALPISKVFFCNSGAEANEAALKLSRKTGKSRIISTEGSFHGRTMGALSLTGQPAKRDIFKPILKKIKYVEFGNVQSLKSAINRKTAMVIVEPIQGENGVIVPPKNYLKAVREICNEYGALMVLDCVQTGMGRTGTFFGYESEGITPDVITLAKGLGGGLPIGAMIAIGPAAHLFKPGDHGSTFGGNPVSAAAGIAVITEIKKRKLELNATKMGEKLFALAKGTKEYYDTHDKVSELFCKSKLQQITKSAEEIQSVLARKPR